MKIYNYFVIMMENSKTQYQNVLTQNRVIKKIHKLKIKLQDRIKNMSERERERENNQFSLENVRGNSKFIENKIRRKKKVKMKDMVMNTKLFKSCFVTFFFFFCVGKICIE